MKIAQLKTIVKRGESQTLEFKSSTASLKEGMKTICAFLNSDQGGMVLVGVKDDGTITGQHIADATHKALANEINKIEPHIKIDVQYVQVADDRKVIILTVTPDDRAPYTYDGCAYVRNQSTTMQMPKDEYTYLHNKNNPGLWESLANKNCTIKDLDHERIKEIIRIGVFEKRLPEDAMTATVISNLKKLNLMVEDKPTNAAVILFCKNEDKQFMQASIQLARFKGTTKNEFLDNKKYRANAFDLYDKAMNFLVFCLPVAAHIEPGKSSRVETPTIPYSVLREALINALAHREYSNAGGNISVAVYDDRVNITNIGALPRGVELNKLSKEHPSVQRNPLISSVFFACGKIEKWGRGTLNMISDSKAAGNPLPIYEEIGGSFSVTLPFKEPMPTIIYKHKQNSAVFNDLTDRQREILEILQQGPLKMSQILQKITISLTDRTMQLELAKLKKMGLIQSLGKTKASVWTLPDTD